MFKILFLYLLLHVINCEIRLPAYVGLGYDIFKGNPKTNRIDRGFRSSIFKLSYGNERKTEDRKYVIPDKTISKTRHSCTYSSNVNQYTGTKEYQKNLKTLVSLGGSVNALVASASFSASTEFISMEKDTRIDREVVIETGSNCEIYSLEIPLFQTINLTADFKTAIFSAFNNKTDWTKIVEIFGTHFVSKTILGSRSHVFYKLKSKSFQELNAKGINVKVAAKFRYAKYSGDTNIEWKKNENIVNEFETKVEETEQSYIGLRPPKCGNGNDWYDLASDMPAPIEYTLASISDLFSNEYFGNLSSNELNFMKAKFELAIQSYCNSLKTCKAPGEDFVLPSARAVTSETEVLGKSVGTSFKDSAPVNPFMNVRKVLIREAKGNSLITQIQLYLSDSFTSYFTGAHGKQDGNLREWSVPYGQFISQIELVTTDTFVQSVTFITNKGDKSPKFGAQNDLYKILWYFPFPKRIPSKYTLLNLKGNLVGVKGYYENTLTQIGFISNEITYN